MKPHQGDPRFGVQGIQQVGQCIAAACAIAKAGLSGAAFTIGAAGSVFKAGLAAA